MNLYFDTSALLKRYVQEIGSDIVDELFEKSDIIYVSNITHVECCSALKRLHNDKALSKKSYEFIKEELRIDFENFRKINFSETIEDRCFELFEKYQIKTLDCIHLASLSIIKDKINYFVSFDEQLVKYVKREGIQVIDTKGKSI